MNKWLRPDEAQDVAGRSIATLKRWAKAGKVKTRKDQGSQKIKVMQLRLCKA